MSTSSRSRRRSLATSPYPGSRRDGSRLVPTESSARYVLDYADCLYLVIARAISHQRFASDNRAALYPRADRIRNLFMAAAGVIELTREGIPSSSRSLSLPRVRRASSPYSPLWSPPCLLIDLSWSCEWLSRRGHLALRRPFTSQGEYLDAYRHKRFLCFTGFMPSRRIRCAEKSRFNWMPDRRCLLCIIGMRAGTRTNRFPIKARFSRNWRRAEKVSVRPPCPLAGRLFTSLRGHRSCGKLTLATFTRVLITMIAAESVTKAPCVKCVTFLSFEFLWDRANSRCPIRSAPSELRGRK